MKVIIAGGRDFDDYEALKEAIKQSKFKIKEVVSGAAKGADSLGERWAKENNVPVKQFKPDWNNTNHPDAIVKFKQNPWTKKEEAYDWGAGFRRNGEMAKYADALIAMPGDGGTANMIKQAKENKLKIYIYEPKQEIEYEF